MRPHITREMQKFLTPAVDPVSGREIEEVIDQPLYHVQTYAAAGATSFTFFATATGGYTVTNMDAASVLSKGKRFAVFGIGIQFLAGQNIVQDTANTTLDSALNDAQNVLEGLGYLELNVLDKNYLRESPLSRVPAGHGIFVGGAAFQRTQASAADGTRQISYGTNGLPTPACRRWLRVPIPIPEQVRFSVTLTFPTAVTVTTAGLIGCWLDGSMIRAIQ